MASPLEMLQLGQSFDPYGEFRKGGMEAQQYDVEQQKLNLQQQAMKEAQTDMGQQGLPGMTGVGAQSGKPQQGLAQMSANLLGPQYKLETEDGIPTSAGLVNQQLVTSKQEAATAQKLAKDANMARAMGDTKEYNNLMAEARRYQTQSGITAKNAKEGIQKAKDDFASTLYSAKSQEDYDRRLKDILDRTGIDMPKDMPTTWTPDMKEKLLSKMSPETRAKIEKEDRAEAAAQHKEKMDNLREQRLEALLRGGGTAGAGKESPQSTRVIQAFTQTSDALQNVANLPITTGPIFQQKQFGSLYTAPLSALNQKLSDDTSQMLQTRMTGVARGLAALESGGAATGLVGLTDSIEKGVFIPAGASLGVALDKLGEMRRIVESSGKAQLNDPKLSPERKKLIQDELDIVRKAIPFTQADVDKAMKASKKNPNVSFTDFATTKPIGEGPLDTKGVKGNSIPTVTSQEQYDVLKSGAEYIEDGKKFRKP